MLNNLSKIAASLMVNITKMWKLVLKASQHNPKVIFMEVSQCKKNTFQMANAILWLVKKAFKEQCFMDVKKLYLKTPFNPFVKKDKLLLIDTKIRIVKYLKKLRSVFPVV